MIATSCSIGGHTLRRKCGDMESRSEICDATKKQEQLYWQKSNFRYGNKADGKKMNVGLVTPTVVINWSGIHIWWQGKHIRAMSGHNVNLGGGKDQCWTYLAISTTFCYWTLRPKYTATFCSSIHKQKYTSSPTLDHLRATHNFSTRLLPFCL